MGIDTSKTKHYGKARQLFLTSLYQASIVAFETEPENADALVVLGTAYFEVERSLGLDRNLERNAAFRKVSSLQHEDWHLMYVLAITYIATGEQFEEKALQCLESAAEDHSEEAIVHYYRGLLFFNRGERQLSRSAVELALSLEPGYLAANVLLESLTRAEPASKGRKRKFRPPILL